MMYRQMASGSVHPMQLDSICIFTSPYNKANKGAVTVDLILTLDFILYPIVIRLKIIFVVPSYITIIVSRFFFIKPSSFLYN